MRRLLSTTLTLLLLAAPGMALAGNSKCDSDVTKAIIKKLSCDGKLYSDAQKSGTPPDQNALDKCDQDFLDKCTKIKQKDPSGCVVHTQDCPAIADGLAACVNAIAN